MPKGMKGQTKPYKYYLQEEIFNNEQAAIDFTNYIVKTYTTYCLYHYGKPYYYTLEKDGELVYIVSYIKVCARKKDCEES